MLHNSHLKRLMGKWNSRGFGPFIVNKVVADGSIELKDPGEEIMFLRGQISNTVS